MFFRYLLYVCHTGRPSTYSYACALHHWNFGQVDAAEVTYSCSSTTLKFAELLLTVSNLRLEVLDGIERNARRC
jgi:hypothetical protein